MHPEQPSIGDEPNRLSAEARSASPPMLEIALTHFRLRRRILAESLAISVPAKEVHALTGPNGCGKTLMFDSISGIGEAEGAACRVAEISLDTRHPSQRWSLGVRRLFQQPLLPPSLTVEHVLREAGVHHLERVTTLLRSVRIPIAVRLSQLSFGQVRIVELCATAGASKTILLDEPFAGISAVYQRPIIEFIQQCAASGPAVLCIDHLHASNMPLYRQVHTWPSPPTVLDPASASFGSPNEFPLSSLADINISGAAASWTMSRVQVNSTLIAADFALTLEPGAIALIIGSNGSGKSTLVRALSGIPQPSSSFVTSAKVLPPSGDLIFSPQPPKLVPELTVKDNLALMINRCFRLEQGIITQASQLLRWLRGGPLPITALAGNLSGGEASLCALVGGILSRRRIVVLDEAMEGLSPHTRERATFLTKQASLKGQSFVMTAHVTTSPTLSECHTLNLDTDTPLSGNLHLGPNQARNPRLYEQ